VIGLCDRWHKLPEEIENMDAGALRLLAVYDRAHPRDQEVSEYE